MDLLPKFISEIECTVFAILWLLFRMAGTVDMSMQGLAASAPAK